MTRELGIGNWELGRQTKAPPGKGCWTGIGLLALFFGAALLPAVPARAEDEPIPREVEYAIDRGLDWLSKNQDNKGNWNGEGSTSAAATGLAVMAFMARGHVPGQGPYGETINRGIDAILAKQAANGVFGTDPRSNSIMYEHGICTVALCEAYGMLDDKRQAACRTAIAKGVRVILNAQSIRKNAGDQGGWRYTPDANDSDISVSGWQLMALRGASNAGAAVPQSALDAGIAYIKRRAVFGGGFAYQGESGPNAARTGTGILALTLMNQADAPEVKSGADYLLRTRIGTGDGHYSYTVYYCAQAAWQLGGKYWSILNPEISASIRGRQRPDGSWPNTNDSGGSNFYSTAMAILALTVPYRYLPIYQR